MRILSIIGGVLCKASIASAAYDQNVGFKALYYSGATHCDANKLKAWTCGTPCTKEPGVTSLTMVSNDAKGTLGFVAYNS